MNALNTGIALIGRRGRVGAFGAVAFACCVAIGLRFGSVAIAILRIVSTRSDSVRASVGDRMLASQCKVFWSWTIGLGQYVCA